MSTQNTVESGHYDYTYDEQIDSTLHIFSNKSMSSNDFTAQETLDLLHFLEAHRTQIEVKAQQQAQEAQASKQPKSLEQRLNNLFGEGRRHL